MGGWWKRVVMAVVCLVVPSWAWEAYSPRIVVRIFRSQTHGVNLRLSAFSTVSYVIPSVTPGQSTQATRKVTVGSRSSSEFETVHHEIEKTQKPSTPLSFSPPKPDGRLPLTVTEKE